MQTAHEARLVEYKLPAPLERHLISERHAGRTVHKVAEGHALASADISERLHSERRVLCCLDDHHCRVGSAAVLKLAGNREDADRLAVDVEEVCLEPASRAGARENSTQ